MHIRTLLILATVLVLAIPVAAANYYVSPSGSDANSGLSQSEAWLTIDNSTAEHVIVPGDTVNILPGTYLVNSTVDLKTQGTAGHLVVYRGYGGRPKIDGQGKDFHIVTLSEKFIELRGLEITGSKKSGVRLSKDSCLVSSCFVHDVDDNGVSVESSGNRVIRSLLAACGQAGIYNLKGKKNNEFYCNTIYDDNTGIDIQVNETSARVVDNVIAFCNHGISGVVGNLAAFNLLWQNNAGDYFGGIVDSAGGMSVDPVFVDTAAGDYRLGFGSPAIDAGIDVGCTFTGLAPDIGAFETGELHHLAILPVRDTLSADSIYQFHAIAYDSAGGPAPTGRLTWATTFATGSVDSTGLFSPVGSGLGTVSVTSDLGGVTAATGTMYVRAGVPVSVSISPDSATVPAGSSQAFSAVGLDQHGNSVTAFDSISWSLTGAIGSINSSGLFSATTVGTGYLEAMCGAGLNATSGTIRVIPGPLATLDVLPATNIVATLHSYQYSALGYDAFLNLIGDFTDSVTWTTTDLVGGITSTGNFTAGLVGTYWVKAARGGLRDSGEVTVTLAGGLDHIRIESLGGVPIGTLNLSTDVDSTHLVARGYTAANALIGDVSVDWSVLGPDTVCELTEALGPSTELVLHRPGLIKIVALHASGLADSTGTITVTAGIPASMVIRPDTLTLHAGDTQRFTSTAYDADENVANPQPIPSWSTSGGVGLVANDGLFTAQHEGEGRLIATAGTIVDSSGPVTVLAGPLATINIVPDSVTVRIGDTVQFTAVGRDVAGNVTDPGVISWRELGHLGSIDASGRFVARVPGRGAIAASNQLAGIVDTSGQLRVEELYLSTVPLGNGLIRPGGDEVAVAEFHIDNFFSVSKTLTSVSIRDLSSGEGSAEELGANMATARIYMDRNGDSLLSAGDSLLAEVPYGSSIMTLALPSITISPDSGLTFIVTATSALAARDGDTVDVALIPGIDIGTADSTIVSGPPLSNSLGVVRIDGMVAAQIGVPSGPGTTLRNSDSLQLCLSLDLPRNGYTFDTLNSLTIVNSGTATPSDFDSVMLYADNGDSIWNGPATDLSLGPMVFNGESWSRGGLAVEINHPTARFFVVARLSQFPGDGATVAFGIPLDGVRMSSGDDGPIDVPVRARDTLVIQGRQAIMATSLPIPAGTCIPGQKSRSLFAVQLTNGYAQSVAIDSCRFAFVGSDPQGATVGQLAGQIDSVFLYLNRDGDPSSIGASDSLIAAGVMSGGNARFQLTPTPIAGNGGRVELEVAAKLSLLGSRNGNSIGFALADSTSVNFDHPARLTGTFPLQNSASMTINAFPASAALVHSIQNENLYAGEVDKPVFDFELPRNGYASDKLSRIKIVNSGSLSDATVLEHVRLWKDASGNGFSADDIPIGEFIPGSDGWLLDKIKVSLDSVRTRFVVTVSVSAKQFDGGTLRFDLPVAGVQTSSGMTGPDDGSLTNPSVFLIFPSNRVTAISIPLASTQVYPGAPENTIMTFALYNGYVGQTKTLSQVTLTNSSHSSGLASFADHELGRVSLYWDIDRNRVLDNDQLIGSGLFSGGKLRLDGFAAQLPPESLGYFFVISEPPLDLIDGDSLAVSIDQPTDMAFTDLVNLNGDLPLSSGGHLIVDGSVKRQYSLLGPSGRSAAPGDTSIVLLALTPAHNGDRPDVLTDVSVNNLGTAGPGSISSLTLWKDVNEDGLPAAGDSLIGTFAYSAGAWSLSGAGLTISAASPHLLVVAGLSDSAQPGATVQIGIPKLGFSYQSGNDGPIDSALVAPGLFTVSTSGLKVSLGNVPKSFSVGQVIDVPLTITNVTPASIDSVYGTLPLIHDSALVRFDSSVAGPVNLASGETFTCHFYFTASAEGSEYWWLRARSRSPMDSSVTIQTPAAMIQRAISPVSPKLLSTSPTAVTKGQTNIFPMTLGCTHPDTGAASAAMSLDWIHVRVLDEQNLPLPANSAFSRIAIATGSEILAVVTTIPAQADLVLPFDHKVVIEPGTSQNILLILDIASNATASNFRVSVDSSSWLPLADANTGQTIPTAPQTIYPLRSAPTRIDSPSQQVAVLASSISRPTINFGQQDAGILKLRLRHTGQPGSSAAQLTQVRLESTDSTGTRIPAADLFSRVSVWRQNYLIGEISPVAGDTSAMAISLSNPLTLNAQEQDSITISVSAKTSAPETGFILKIPDSTEIVVRDLNTGSSLLAVSDSALALGTAFPITSAWNSFRYPAGHPVLCPINASPVSVLGGADSVELVSLSLSYPSTAQYSSVRLAHVRLLLVDSNGEEITPSELLDRVGVRLNTGPIRYNQILAVTGRDLEVSLNDTGLVLLPGDSVDINIVGDLRLEASESSFATRITGLNDVDAYDVSDPARSVSAAAASGCSETYPFTTSATSILLPAGRPTALPASRPVQIASTGSSHVILFDGSLRYSSPSPLGDIEIRGLQASLNRRVPNGASSQPVSASIGKVAFEVDGQTVGIDSLLTGNRVSIALATPLIVSRGDELPVRVTCDIPANALPGNVTMTFLDSTFLTLQDRSLATAVFPVLSGSGYPVAAGEISIVPADLKTSFTNYPNPFNPSRGEQTTIGFILNENARIDIEIFSITGEPVVDVASGAYRPAGAYQTDVWTGHNGSGQAVLPGTYYCRVTATFDSGRVETFRRKIAVVR